MARSYEEINYMIRPAKNIERKMLAVAFQRLTLLDRLDNYRYIGFGSTCFGDFSLFHKQLGIISMISIEGDTENQDRFRFNIPFKCIEMKFGMSNDVLPELAWDVKTILWLDYDSEINQSILTDVRFAVANLLPGSMFVISVNAHAKSIQSCSSRLADLKDRVGEETVPIGITEKEMSGWGTALVTRRITNNAIESTLRARNGALDKDEIIRYKQIFNIHYADGAKMLTVGGLLYDDHQAAEVERCAFEQLDYIRTSEEAYLIEVPVLTYREIRHIDKQLPNFKSEDLIASAIPQADLQKYAKLYRYFPMFTEAEM